jgi:hypothetical protein
MEISKKKNQKWQLLEKKADLRGSTKLFQNLTADSDSATQNSLITDKIPNETCFIRAQINFDRKLYWSTKHKRRIPHCQ